MKRRSFGLMAGTSMFALTDVGRLAYAQQTTPDASLLSTSLTPFGAERAGNADGSIPAWTGGYTTVPAGWQPGHAMPDMFASEQPILTIDSSNAAQYADKLNDGTQAMISKYGFVLKVYETHRTAAAPQTVYDSIASNVATAKLVPQGGRWGFTGGFGGAPFPILDTSDPYSAGPQIMWNHLTRWIGYAKIDVTHGWIVNSGQAILSDSGAGWEDFPYYKPGGSLATFNGMNYRLLGKLLAPANLTGQESLTWSYTNIAANPVQDWTVLSGQGRVRKSPEVEFDTPSLYADGVCNYDEYYAFNGSLEKYDWKFIEKKEMYIPYNNNGLCLLPPEPVHLAHFLDPNVIRWELHRVWVVEATLHPGERNVLSRRRFYVDEDTWIIAVGEAWDAKNNLFRVYQNFNLVRPDLPGTVYLNGAIYNMQTDDYCTPSGWWNEAAKPTLNYVSSIPDATFDPQTLAADSAY